MLQCFGLPLGGSTQWQFYGLPLGGSTQWLLCIAMQWTAARGQHSMAALWLFYGQPLRGSSEMHFNGLPLGGSTE